MCVGLSTTYLKEFFAKLKIGRKYLMKVKIFQTFQIVKNEHLVFFDQDGRKWIASYLPYSFGHHNPIYVFKVCKMA